MDPEAPEEEPESPAADDEPGDGEKPAAAAKAKEAEKPAAGYKRQGGYQRRIERLERQNQQLLDQLQRGGAAPVPPKAKTPEEQTAEQFEKLVDARMAQREAEREQKATVAKFQERATAIRAAHPDFDEVVADVSHIPVSPAVQEALLTSDVGPEIMYQLATNPAELARISALPPLVAVREIGRLEAKAASGSTPQKPGQAKRPPVPPSNVGGAAAKSTRNLVDLPLSEYKKAMNARRR